MKQNTNQTDPIVEILRLAYRRGLVLRQQQNETAKQQSPTELTELNDIMNQAGQDGARSQT
jgi:hypothetical protein